VDCSETQNLVHAYVDGELDPAHELEIEQHLQGCTSCARASENWQSLRSVFGPSQLSFQAPPGLRTRILGTLPPGIDQSRSSRPGLPRRWMSAAALVAASVLIVTLGSWAMVQYYLKASAEDLLIKELTSSHVRSQLVIGHLTDVASADRHTVKPWFSGKLNFSPPVANFKDEGFRLVGARLDYLDDKPVAVLVYKHDEHIINLFVWRTACGVDRNLESMSRQGFHIAHWIHADLEYWAISDVASSELQRFATLVQGQH
jgi:anti-sigma factor RsiW